MEIFDSFYKKSNNLLFFLTILIIVLFLTPTLVYSQLKITLSLDKDTYLEDESIWFEAVLENIDDKVLYTSYFIVSQPLYCKVILKDSDGNELTFKGGTSFIPYNPEFQGYEMKPGQEMYLISNLLAIFGEIDKNHSSVFYLRPGHYSLQVINHTNYHWLAEIRDELKKIGPAAYDMADKRTVFSNIVEFDVVEPEGIEKVVHDKLLQAYRLSRKITQGSTIQTEIFPILKSIIDDYPESVYVTAAHEEFHGLGAYLYGYRWDVIEEAVRFKDRIYCYTLIEGLKKEVALKHFPNLRSKYPDRRLSKYIDYQYKYGYLKEVE